MRGPKVMVKFKDAEELATIEHFGKKYFKLDLKTFVRMCAISAVNEVANKLKETEVKKGEADERSSEA